MLDHIALQLDREEIKGREDGKRSKWGDYLREAINQGTAIIIILFEEIRQIHSVTLFSYLHKD